MDRRSGALADVVLSLISYLSRERKANLCRNVLSEGDAGKVETEFVLLRRKERMGWG